MSEAELELKSVIKTLVEYAKALLHLLLRRNGGRRQEL